MTKTVATWIPVWRVSPDGYALTEWRASIGERVATVRKVDQTRGGEAWNRGYYDQLFADSPAGAIAKFIERQQVIAGKAREELALAEMLVRRGEALRQTLAVMS